MGHASILHHNFQFLSLQLYGLVAATDTQELGTVRSGARDIPECRAEPT